MAFSTYRRRSATDAPDPDNKETKNSPDKTLARTSRSRAFTLPPLSPRKSLSNLLGSARRGDKGGRKGRWPAGPETFAADETYEADEGETESNTCDDELDPDRGRSGRTSIRSTPPLKRPPSPHPLKGTLSLKLSKLHRPSYPRSTSASPERTVSPPKSFLESLAGAIRAPTSFFYKEKETRATEPEEAGPDPKPPSSSPEKMVRFKSGESIIEPRSSPIDIPRAPATISSLPPIGATPFSQNFGKSTEHLLFMTARPPDCDSKPLENSAEFRAAVAAVSASQVIANLDDRIAETPCKHPEEQAMVDPQPNETPTTSGLVHACHSEQALLDEQPVLRNNSLSVPCCCRITPLDVCRATDSPPRRKEKSVPLASEAITTIADIFNDPVALNEDALPAHAATSQPSSRFQKMLSPAFDPFGQSTASCGPALKVPNLTDGHTQGSSDASDAGSSIRRLYHTAVLSVPEALIGLAEGATPPEAEALANISNIADVATDGAQQMSRKFLKAQSPPLKSETETETVSATDLGPPALSLTENLSYTLPIRTRLPVHSRIPVDASELPQQLETSKEVSDPSSFIETPCVLEMKRMTEKGDDCGEDTKFRQPPPASIDGLPDIPPEKRAHVRLYIDQNGWSPFQEPRFLLAASGCLQTSEDDFRNLLCLPAGFARFWKECSLPSKTAPPADTKALTVIEIEELVNEVFREAVVKLEDQNQGLEARYPIKSKITAENQKRTLSEASSDSRLGTSPEDSSDLDSIRHSASRIPSLDGSMSVD